MNGTHMNTCKDSSRALFLSFLGGRHIIQGGMGCICIYECAQTNNKINVVQPNMQAKDHEYVRSIMPSSIMESITVIELYNH